MGQLALLGLYRGNTRIMENQMENETENEMDIGIIIGYFWRDCGQLPHVYHQQEGFILECDFSLFATNAT